MPFNIPNNLTLIRVAMVPVFVVVFYLPWRWAHIFGAAIFTLAALTDWLDGYLARRLNQTTKFGAFLDPVADKLMVAMALVMLVDRNPTPFPDMLMAFPAAVIIGREIVISALREWMAELGERAEVAVSTIGKIKTFAQMVAIILLLYREPVLDFPTAETGLVLLYVAAVLTLWSMLIYLRAAWPALRNNSIPEDEL